MPVSPTPDDSYYWEIAQSYQQAEFEILGQIKTRLDKGEQLSDLQWQTERLAEVQVLRRDATKTLAGVNQSMASKVSGSLGNAYKDGSVAALKDTAAFLPTKPSAVSSAARKASVAALARGTITKVAGVLPGMLRQMEDDYRSVVKTAVRSVAAGSMDRKTATSRALQQAFGMGLKTGPGSKMNLPDYVTMAVRTGTANAMIQGHLDALGANGIDLVYIEPGPRVCDRCDPWCNKPLYRTSGKSGMYLFDNMVDASKRTKVWVAGNLSDAKAAGWGHPNCRCGVSAYIPGATSLPSPRPEWDKEGYEAQQKQRAMERKVREWKTRELLATGQDKIKARAKVNLWQAGLQGLMKEHPYLKRQSKREQVAPGDGSTPPKPRTPSPRPPKVSPKPSDNPPAPPGTPPKTLTGAEKARNAEKMYGTDSLQHRQAVRDATDRWDERTATKYDDFVDPYKRASNEAHTRLQTLRADQIPDDRLYDEDPSYYAWNTRRKQLLKAGNDMAAVEKAAKTAKTRAATQAKKDAEEANAGKPGPKFVAKYGDKSESNSTLPMSVVTPGTNPNGHGWKTGRIEEGYAVNCTRVSAALELRVRGYDVQAGFADNTYRDKSVPDIENNWRDANGNVRRASVGKSHEELEKIAEGDPIGSRYFLVAAWRGGGAHIWNAEKTRAGLIYREAQTKMAGTVTSMYIQQINWDTGRPSGSRGEGVSILRVDDLQPQDSLVDKKWLVSAT